MLDLFYIDTSAQRREIEIGMSKLRQLGGPYMAQAISCGFLYGDS